MLLNNTFLKNYTDKYENYSDKQRFEMNKKRRLFQSINL